MQDLAQEQLGAVGLGVGKELGRLIHLDDLAAILRVAAEDDVPRVDVERLAAAARLGALRERLRGSGRHLDAGQEAGIVAIF